MTSCQDGCFRSIIRSISPRKLLDDVLQARAEEFGDHSRDAVNGIAADFPIFLTRAGSGARRSVLPSCRL
jgi:hypothetical protein